MTETQEAAAMLKRARARFTGPEAIVNAFHHIFEYADGTHLYYDDGLNMFKGGKTPARSCVFGFLYLETLNSDPEKESAGRLAGNTLEEGIPKDKSIMGGYNFTLTEILHYYDVAIEKLEKGDGTA